MAIIAAQTANAVYELVVIERPFHARRVSGIVLDPLGEPLAAAEVRDYDPQFKEILAATRTDQRGNFSLPNGGRSVHHLRIYARGMNPLQATIILRLFSRSRIRIKLHFGG
jgi:hypothetical protein